MPALVCLVRRRRCCCCCRRRRRCHCVFCCCPFLCLLCGCVIAVVIVLLLLRLEAVSENTRVSCAMCNKAQEVRRSRQRHSHVCMHACIHTHTGNSNHIPIGNSSSIHANVGNRHNIHTYTHIGKLLATSLLSIGNRNSIHTEVIVITYTHSIVLAYIHRKSS